MNHGTVKVLIGTVSGLLVGGFAGYYFTKRALTKEFDELLDIEVAAVKKHYKEKSEESTGSTSASLLDTALKADEGATIDLSKARKEHANLVKDNYYGSSKPGVVEEKEVEPLEVNSDDLHEPTGFIIDYEPKKVFGPDYIPPPLMDGGPIDYTEPSLRQMIQNRDPSAPYIITVDEFMDDNPEFEKQNVTYFKGDDSLCDERDEIIPDIEDNVGRENLEHFGLYSRDNEIVYVRNERISVDFEIAFDPRTYIEAIAGFKFRNIIDHEPEDD